jgi:hypothetical protein
MAVQGNLLAGSDLTRMVAAVQGNRPKTIGEFADEQRILQQKRASDMMKFGADFALSKAKLDSSIQENQAMMEFRRASLAQDKAIADRTYDLKKEELKQEKTSQGVKNKLLKEQTEASQANRRLSQEIFDQDKKNQRTANIQSTITLSTSIAENALKELSSAQDRLTPLIESSPEAAALYQSIAKEQNRINGTLGKYAKLATYQVQGGEFDDLPLRSRLMFVDKQKFPSTFEKTEERINELNKLLDRVNQGEYANQRDKKQVENRIEKLTQSLSTVFNPSSKFGKSARGLYESGNVPSYILDSFAPNVDITVLNRLITENAGKSLGLNDPTKLKSGLD